MASVNLFSAHAVGIPSYRPDVNVGLIIIHPRPDDSFKYPGLFNFLF